MRHSLLLATVSVAASLSLSLVACSSSKDPSPTPLVESDAGAGDGEADGAVAPPAASKIEHLVVIVQENHTFDTYFGRYCTAATGSNPTCITGPSCCEAGPMMEPGGSPPSVLDDALNSGRDPNHTQACELAEMNGGKMDKYTTDGCGDPKNFAYADPTLIKPYHDLAAGGALADRYFQPLVGQSSSNDMYFARANYVFTDNSFNPKATGLNCLLNMRSGEYTDPTIADLLIAKGVSFAWYGEGYQDMKDSPGKCPAPPSGCAAKVSTYPCVYDPGDSPFQYYPTVRDKAEYIRDFKALALDIGSGKLPAVSFVKPLGYKSEHPGFGDKISDGIAFVTGVIDAVQKSSYGASTLVLLTYDEGGGFFDHITPPSNAAADGKPYGTRVPLLAVGPFVKKNTVSHVTMEHSSIVKFIEWNWLGETGQLKTRDGEVNNIGSLLDPAATGAAVPEK